MRASVIVPTYHRADLLGRCLAALGSQQVGPGDYEVVVADDAASPATRRQTEEFAASSRATVRYVAVTGPHGPAAARNAGWRAARGEVLAFTDDDCLPAPDWLAEGLAALGADPAASAASGKVVVPLPDCPTDYERDAAGLERAEFVTANLFCHREALETVGGFDERFTAAWREDSDLQFALLGLGRRIVSAPRAVVVHPVRPAPWGVCLKQTRKVLFDALLYKKHPHLYRRHIRRWPRWDYYATVAAAGASLAAALAGAPLASLAAAGVWTALTGQFCARRLRGTSRSPGHIAEMVLTSALVPPLAVFWRLYGAVKFRVLFL